MEKFDPNECKTKEGLHWKQRHDKLKKELDLLKSRNMSLEAQIAKLRGESQP
jgi:cell division protein FtsB